MTALVADGSTSACTAGTPARRASAEEGRAVVEAALDSGVDRGVPRVRPARREPDAIHSVQGERVLGVGAYPPRRDAGGKEGERRVDLPVGQMSLVAITENDDSGR